MWWHLPTRRTKTRRSFFGGESSIQALQEPSASSRPEEEEEHEQAEAAVPVPSLAHMGQIKVEGTLMAADKQAIKETTGVVCSVRGGCYQVARFELAHHHRKSFLAMGAS